MSDSTLKIIIGSQKTEITEHLIYKNLSLVEKDKHNREVLDGISKDELKHYEFWKKHTTLDIQPDYFKVKLYSVITKILGLTFGVRLMEKGEEDAQKIYKKISKEIPNAKEILEDEEKHEQQLLDLIDEERLKYIGSIVLGLNDALVELTGALAGLTFVLQNPRLVAAAGLVTGIAASFSMAASEYLSTKAQKENGQNPIKSSVYTGIAYILTVLFLIFPYLVLNNLFLSLGLALANAILVIVAFTFYTSVAQNQPFFKRFFEMAAISLGVAGLSFGIGLAVRNIFGIEA